MAEHFRDFLNPEVDTYAEKVLEPESDSRRRFLLKHGPGILEFLGGEKIASNFDGEQWQFGSGEQSAVMNIHEPDIVIPAILRYRDIGLFYSYTGKDYPLWTPNAEKTKIPPEVYTGHPAADGLVPLAEALYQASNRLRKVGRLAAKALAPIRDPIARRRWAKSTDRTKQQIRAHYDIRQDVYTGTHGFLDREFVQYSSGLLPPGHEFESLEDLQRHKVDSLADKLQLDSAQTGLEIGSGWGGLVVDLAKRNQDTQWTSITVSDEQLKRAQQRAEVNGVGNQIDLQGVDYREFGVDEPFDRVVSVEMIEAVDWRDTDEYFDSLVRFADPKNGVIVIQSINIKPEQFAQQKHNKSFANTAIFPGGVLIPKQEIIDGMASRGWRKHEETELTSSYALTLREWSRRFNHNILILSEKWLSEGVSRAQIGRFHRGFNFYLNFSQAGFRPGTDHLQDWQLAFQPS